MKRRVVGFMLILAAFAVMGFAAQAATVQAAPPIQAVKGDPTRGAYLFALNGGCGCHQGQAGFLAGGTEFSGPFGTVYAPNITSDQETGIGKWSEQDIVNVLRTGKTPNGEQLFPAMPYPSFSGMSEQDQHDLAAYIKTVPAVKNVVPERKLNVPVPPFSPPPQAQLAPTSGEERGKYLVNTISICSDCHTPQGPTGPDFTKFLAGGQVNPDNYAPNITPDVETGIGSWSQEQIVLELKTGKKPDGSEVRGLMHEQVQGGYKDMTLEDAFAIAAYLKSIPAIKNSPSSAPPATQPLLPTTGGSPLNLIVLIGLFAVGGILLLGGVVLWRGGWKRIE
ncbi:MAG TPA: cytochrome c [Anaerolineae bacterium]|nr:cytochrome c [Anaerolineae bacterium]